MATPVAEDSGQLTATGSGTEDLVSTQSIARTFCFVVDLTNMTAVDTVTLRMYRKVRSGGALALAYEETFAGVQAQPVAISVPMPSPHQATFTITQENAAPKAFPWDVESM